MDPHLNETEVQYNRIKVGNALMEVFHIPSSVNDTVITFCYGIPSHPFDRFPFGLESYLRQGYILAYPHYEGTFGSNGLCTLENAVDSVVSTVQALLKGELHDLMSEEKLEIDPRRVVLAGGSFGGSVALLAASKSDEINDVISVAGPIDYRERNFSRLEGKLRRAYEKEWHIDPSIWERLSQGRLDINPIDYVDRLKTKNTYLIHGETDPAVPVEQSVRLHKMLRGGFGKHKILIEPNVGHIGCHYIGIERVHKLVESWMVE